MPQGILFLISAPSGAGKTSLVNALLDASGNDRASGLRVSISHTTRPKRPGEEDGKNYHFVSVTQFQQMQTEHAFLESAEVFGNYYGTSKSWVTEQLANGQDVILEIDWQGASQVQALLPESVGIFILPPSLQALRERLTSRGQDDADVIETRMNEAVNEIAHFEQADFIVINENFDAALEDLKAVIRSARLNKSHQVKSNSDLLNKLIS
jgi:guanylate kinase